MIALLLARDHPATAGGLVLVGAYAGWAGSLDADALAQRIAAARFTIDHPVDEWADDLLGSVYAPDAAPARRDLPDLRRLPRSASSGPHPATGPLRDPLPGTVTGPKTSGLRVESGLGIALSDFGVGGVVARYG